jgi:hypothetical protein
MVNEIPVGTASCVAPPREAGARGTDITSSRPAEVGQIQIIPGSARRRIYARQHFQVDFDLQRDRREDQHNREDCCARDD